MPGRVWSIALALVAVGSAAALLAAQAIVPPAAPVSFTTDVDADSRAQLPRLVTATRSRWASSICVRARRRCAAARTVRRSSRRTPSRAASIAWSQVSSSRQCRCQGTLSAQDVATLKAWIDQGAPWNVAVGFARDIQPVFEGSCAACHGETAQLSDSICARAKRALRGGAARVGYRARPRRRKPVVCAASPDSSGRRCRRRAAARPPRRSPRSGNGLTKARSGTRLRRRREAIGRRRRSRRSKTARSRPQSGITGPSSRRSPADAGRTANSIDRFLEAGASSARAEGRAAGGSPRARPPGVSRSAGPAADAGTGRRVQLDGCDRPDAWERLIDRLLASPHYGERYGRLWLDIARYADSAGFEYDTHRPNAWRYRDYVIKSFNEDKPYNRFLIEQLAGDEMDGKTSDSARRHRISAHGTARAVPREGQPRAPLRLPRRDHRHDRQGHARASPSTARAATTTSSIRFPRRITTASRRRSSATSRPRCRSRRGPKPTPTWRRTGRSTTTIAETQDRRSNASSIRTANACSSI